MKSTPHHHRHAPLRALATMLLVTHVLSSLAPGRVILKIANRDGSIIIPGETNSVDHPGWMDVFAFGSGLTQVTAGDELPLDPICAPQGFTFHKEIDKATPKIQEALLRGTVFPLVQIKILSSHDFGFAEPIAVELQHLEVTGYHIHGSGNDANPPTEEITLNFSAATWTYREFDQSGNVVSEVATLLSYFPPTRDPSRDDDMDLIPNDLDPDDDNDGIPDDAELASGSDPFRDDADEDPDRDGQSNRDEAIAGTRADDSRDCLGIDRITARRGSADPEMTVQFAVRPGRRYRLLATTAPMQPVDGWVPLHEFDVHTEATPAVVAIDPDILRSTSRLFLRIEASLIPVPK